MLDAVEVGGLRCTGRCQPLRAFENRVYEVELEDERRLVIKFHRPGRWSRETILDEHAFLAELAAAEIPVVPPLDLGTGTTLGEIEGIFYSVFPKVRGRIMDELDAERRRLIGRTIGRMHAVGAARDGKHRPRLSVERYVQEPLEALAAGAFMPEAMLSRYRDVALRIAAAVAPLLATARPQRVHGDLHWGNVLWTSDGPVLVDFDDMVIGPAVQDLWLALPGRDAWALRQRGLFLEGYEQLRAFDRSTLSLIEVLRGLRVVHYAAWLAKRWHDPAFPKAWPQFGTTDYWERETEDLVEQLGIIRGEVTPEQGGYTPETRKEEEPVLTNKDYFWDWEEK